jgi:hypothetical protein
LFDEDVVAVSGRVVLENRVHEERSARLDVDSAACYNLICLQLEYIRSVADDLAAGDGHG